MAREFVLPDIGEGLTEAEIVQWLVPVGGTVAGDGPLVEVETDKAVVEIPSPVQGVVLHHGAAEGEVLAVGAILAVIGEAGETWPADDEPVADPAHGDAPAADAPLVGTLDEVAEDLTARQSVPAASGSGPVLALPLVRKLARERGVDLATVRGTGPGGRITRADVLAASESTSIADAVPKADVQPEISDVEEAPVADETSVEPEAAASERVGASEEVVEGAGAVDEDAPAAAGDSAPATDAREERLRMSKLRRTIAARMSESWTQIPHVTTFDEVDATRLLDVRAALGRRHDTSVRLAALVVKAVLPALAAFGEFNATIDGDELVVKLHYDIAVAVDTPDGLMTPVVHGADRLDLLAVSAEIDRLSAGSVDRSLPAEDLTGGTFTVSNIGAVGGGYGTPLVPPGTTAILSVGRADPKPVVRDGSVVVRPMLPLSLSYDHRVIDGGLGRRFMAMVLENLEEPSLFLA